MADRFWVDAFVAAKSEEEILPFAEEFGAEGVNEVPREQVANSTAIESEVGWTNVLFHVSIGENTCENVDDMEAWLRDRNMPYLLHIEGRYEWMPEAIWWLPDLESSLRCDTNTDYEAIITIEEAREAAIKQTLDKLITPPKFSELLDAAEKLQV